MIQVADQKSHPHVGDGGGAGELYEHCAACQQQAGGVAPHCRTGKNALVTGDELRQHPGKRGGKHEHRRNDNTQNNRENFHWRTL